MPYDETYNETTNNTPSVYPELITNTLPFDVIATMAIISELITRTKIADILPVSICDFKNDNHLYYDDSIKITNHNNIENDDGCIDYPLIYDLNRYIDYIKELKSTAKHPINQHSGKYIYYNDPIGPFSQLLSIFVRQEQNKDPYIVIMHSDVPPNHIGSYFGMEQMVIIENGQMRLTRPSDKSIKNSIRECI